MAFILVLGILVDDAIVVGERVYAHEQEGYGRLEAAVRGTQEVSVPVIFGVFTTMATFIPIINIPGPFGNFFQPLGYTVIDQSVVHWRQVDIHFHRASLTRHTLRPPSPAVTCVALIPGGRASSPASAGNVCRLAPRGKAALAQ